MKPRLTLTMDDAVVGAAKKYVRQSGQSLSGIIENYLRFIGVSGETKEVLSPKVTKLRGVLICPAILIIKMRLQMLY